MIVEEGISGVSKCFADFLHRKVRDNIPVNVFVLIESIQRGEFSSEAHLVLRMRESIYVNWIVALSSNSSGRLEITTVQGTEDNDGTEKDHVIKFVHCEGGNFEAEHFEGYGLYDKILDKLI